VWQTLVLVLLLVTYNFSVARMIVIIFGNILTRSARQDWLYLFTHRSSPGYLPVRVGMTRGVCVAEFSSSIIISDI
jgi:hypothetical protein